MFEAGERLGFAKQSVSRVGSCVGGEQLEGYEAIELCIVGLVDVAVRAPSETLPDLEAAEHQVVRPPEHPVPQLAEHQLCPDILRVQHADGV